MPCALRSEKRRKCSVPTLISAHTPSSSMAGILCHEVVEIARVPKYSGGGRDRLLGFTNDWRHDASREDRKKLTQGRRGRGSTRRGCAVPQRGSGPSQRAVG